MTLNRVRKFALLLPETTEKPHFDYTSFRVRDKIFATAPPEGDYLHVFAADDQRARLVLEHPRFLEELIWGGKVRGLRVFLAAAEPALIDRLLTEAWTRRAPKRLLPKNR